MINKNIYVVGYPKSGCTWLTRLLTRALNGRAVEYPMNKTGRDLAADVNKDIKGDSGYRISKIHFTPKQFKEKFGNNQKIVYIQRNIYDVLVSSFFYFNNKEKDIDDYVKKFCREGNAIFGTYKNHIESWIVEDTIMTCYEMLHVTPIMELKSILKKLNIEPINDVNETVKEEKFDKRQKENPHFFREGKAGNYGKYLNDRQLKYVRDYL